MYMYMYAGHAWKNEEQKWSLGTRQMCMQVETGYLIPVKAGH